MRYWFNGSVLFVALACAAPPALAQTVQTQPAVETDFDYDAATEELPIESEVFGPRLTFTSRSGAVTTFYGQVNLAYQSFDDGTETTANIVDNGNWNSRLGFTYTQPIGDNTLRYRFETGLTLRNSGLVSQTETPDWTDWEKTLLRWFEVAIDTDYGTLSLGQGASASDGTAGLDDSFTFVAGATNSTDGFGSMRFRDDAGNLTNVAIAQVNNAFNGARRFRVRYDTPVVQGVMLSASYGENVLTEADDNDLLRCRPPLDRRHRRFRDPHRRRLPVDRHTGRRHRPKGWPAPSPSSMRRPGSTSPSRPASRSTAPTMSGRGPAGRPTFSTPARPRFRSTTTTAAISCPTAPGPKTTASTPCRASTPFRSTSMQAGGASPTATSWATPIRMPTASLSARAGSSDVLRGPREG